MYFIVFFYSKSPKDFLMLQSQNSIIISSKEQFMVGRVLLVLIRSIISLTFKVNYYFVYAFFTKVRLFISSRWSVYKLTHARTHTHTHTYIYIYIYIYIYKRRNRIIYIYIHHHHVAPLAQISLTLSRHFPYHSSPPAGLQDNILCPHIVAVCKFVLVVLLLHIHMWGSTGVHRLWARPCFSSSVPRVWFV